MAQIPDDIFFASIAEITAHLRSKDFSAVELTRAFCDRLEKIGPRYNALALLESTQSSANGSFTAWLTQKRSAAPCRTR